MSFSIIVPMLNEIAHVPGLVLHLSTLRNQGGEILIVDGGSSDGSAEMVKAADFVVLTSAPGRARQMNLGATFATGNILIFLHADTRLPLHSLSIISEALHDWKYQWGRFDVTISGKSPLLRVVATLVNLRSRMTHIATGDQAIFIRRSLFFSKGGFPEQPLMEDVELSARLRKKYSPAALRQRVITSGRRWEKHGIWKTILLMWRLRWQYWRGVSIEKIAENYRY